MSLARELWDAFVAAYNPEVWALPWAVLALGVGAGIAASVWLTRGNDSSTLVAEGRRADMERRRDQVVRTIRALDQEKEKLDPQDYERERRVLLGQGADALRALDQEMTMEVDTGLAAALEAQREQLGPERYAAIQALLAGAPAPHAPAPSPWISPRWEGALWTLGTVGALLCLFLVLRGIENIDPVEPTTGGGPPPGPGQDQRIAEWEQELSQKPTDLVLLNKLTDVHIATQQWEKAQGFNERALSVNAKDAEARTWNALLVYRAGSYSSAIEQLEAVIAENPKYGRARQFRGIIDLQIGRYAEAVAHFEGALETAEDDRTKLGLRQLIAEARKGMGPAEPEAGTPEFAGTITLAPGVDPGSWGPQAQVVIAVRDPQGPPMPLRAVKLPPGPFPLGFSIRASDAPMRGGPLPAAVNLVFKVDLDGNAMGDDPGAPKITLEAVSPGAEGLSVVFGSAP